MNQSIGVFGEEMLLWICILRQSPRRPPPDHVYRQANFLLDELRSSPVAQLLPVVSAEDGMFAIAALADEVAMSLPDLRPWWSQNMLQARRFNTNNAGVEFFKRLERVRAGPKTMLATYVTVLGCGFLGQYGLPGRDPYLLNELRAQLARELGVDADRDVMGGALKPYRLRRRCRPSSCRRSPSTSRSGSVGCSPWSCSSPAAASSAAVARPVPEGLEMSRIFAGEFESGARRVLRARRHLRRALVPRPSVSRWSASRP